MTKILILDDDKEGSELLKDYLETEGFKIVLAFTATAGLNLLKQEMFDVLLLDIQLPGDDGLKILKAVKAEDAEMTIIVITAYGSVTRAVQAMKDGAYDFIEKPIDTERLLHLLRKAEERGKLLKSEQLLREEFSRARGLLVARSEAMRKVMEQVKQVVGTDFTVLLQGESGTGKELVAHRIHQLSPRSQRPFLAINCASMPETLIESELFGHERGAFTGAITTKKGRLELCDGGTLFLDEIGDMALSTQAHLLRFLEEKTFSRLGGLKTIEVDVRILVATNKNLSQLVAKGSFREDLFYRLNVIPITVPPLRERREDMPDLVDYFIKSFTARLNQAPCSLSDDGKQFLMNYAFPGNVRELKNLLERALVFRKNSAMIAAEDLRSVGMNATTDLVASPVVLKQAEERFRRQHIQKVLTECNGNITRAARMLGLSRSHLSSLVQEIGLK